MTTLRWLKLNREGVTLLELPGLTDYGGQPLTFRPPGFTRRCVTEEVFNDPQLQQYREQLLLVEEVPDEANAMSEPAPASEDASKKVTKKDLEPVTNSDELKAKAEAEAALAAELNAGTKPTETSPGSESAPAETTSESVENSEPSNDSSVSNEKVAPKGGFELKRRGKH